MITGLESYLADVRSDMNKLRKYAIDLQPENYEDVYNDLTVIPDLFITSGNGKFRIYVECTHSTWCELNTWHNIEAIGFVV